MSLSHSLGYDFLVPMQSAEIAWDTSAKRALKALQTVPTGNIVMLRDGIIEPLCSLQEFRDAYSYLVGTIALWAITQDSKQPLWACQTQCYHAGFRLHFGEHDVADALARPGCALLSLLAIDCAGRSGHGQIYRRSDRAFLNSAFQRLGELCFVTDAYPLASLSRHARPAMADLMTTAMELALRTQGALWNEALLHKLVAAIRHSGHFICTSA